MRLGDLVIINRAPRTSPPWAVQLYKDKIPVLVVGITGDALSKYRYLQIFYNGTKWLNIDSAEVISESR